MDMNYLTSVIFRMVKIFPAYFSFVTSKILSQKFYLTVEIEKHLLASNC